MTVKYANIVSVSSLCLNITIVHTVSLCNITARYFTNKSKLISEQPEELQLRVYELWKTIGKSREQGRGTCCYWEEEGKGRGCNNQRVHWRKL